MGRFPVFNQISAFCDCLSLSMAQSFNFESVKAEIYLAGFHIFFPWNGYGHYKPIKFEIISAKSLQQIWIIAGLSVLTKVMTLLKTLKHLLFEKIPFSTGKSLLFLRILQASMLANLLAIRDTFSQQTKQQKRRSCLQFESFKNSFLQLWETTRSLAVLSLFAEGITH